MRVERERLRGECRAAGGMRVLFCIVVLPKASSVKAQESLSPPHSITQTRHTHDDAGNKQMAGQQNCMSLFNFLGRKCTYMKELSWAKGGRRPTLANTQLRQWFKWQQADRPWTGLDIPCDKMDIDLFDASLVATMGKGDKASFWNSNWINGRALKHLAPSLFQKSKRKNISVLKATENNKWISHITPILTIAELNEFILLWEEITLVARVEDSEDEIKWKWTPDGQYTTQSAYQIQFRGQYKKLASTPIWRAKAEPKFRIFAWILLQHKILTANNLAKRGWPHEPVCKLCQTSLETPTHLCMDCPFTRAV
jgi:hypothetical protein